MEAISDTAKALWEVWVEMWKALMAVLPRLLSFIFWVLCAVIIIPCVYVAGELFPLWQKWGEEL